MTKSEAFVLLLSCITLFAATVVFYKAVSLDVKNQSMWIVKNNINQLYFAGFLGDEPQYTKHEEQARTYAQWADAAQICSFLSGNWTPEPLTSKN
jgi:hypothetical protein